MRVIALPEFDNWPPEVDATNPSSWSEGRLAAAQRALDEGRRSVTNPLEKAIIAHIRALLDAVLLARHNSLVPEPAGDIAAGFERLLRESGGA